MLNNQEKTLLYSTVRIVITNSHSSGDSVGTGFIVSVPSPSLEGESYLFLVSNRHVFVDPTHQISLVFTKRQIDSLEPSLGEIAKFSQSGFSGGYIAHPDHNIDLACVNMSSFGEPELGLYFRHYSQENLLNATSQDLSVGQDVFFIGYPDGRYDVVNHLPIMRKGCIASSVNVDFNGEKQFLIDAQVFQGSSGSPVFAEIGREFKIAGVISRTMIKNSMLQNIPVSTAQGIQQPIGLGLVLKVSLLNELLNHAAQHFSTKIS